MTTELSPGDRVAFLRTATNTKTYGALTEVFTAATFRTDHGEIYDFIPVDELTGELTPKDSALKVGDSVLFQPPYLGDEPRVVCGVVIDPFEAVRGEVVRVFEAGLVDVSTDEYPDDTPWLVNLSILGQQ